MPRVTSESSEPHGDIFVGDGEMARLMRAHDWASTSLGPPEAWPNALKVALRLLLTSRFEMWLGWGPDINFFYNDAYRPTLGIKHPRSLATPTRELWAEIWDDIKGRLETVYEKGEATWDRALLLFLERNGYPEETYHTFSYSPLIGDTGKVEGVFCAVSEETDRVISERRLASLRELASGLASADSQAAVFDAVQRKLEANLHDLPFSLTYLFDEDGRAQLACATGIVPGHGCAPLSLEGPGGAWNLDAIWNGEVEHVFDLCTDETLPSGAWNRPPDRAAIVPLVGQGGERPLGALIVGLNPYRPQDDGYVPFLKLLAGQIASSLSSAWAYEAERERAAALADAVQMRQQAAEALRVANRRLATEVEQRTAERDRLRQLFEEAPSFMAVLRGPEHVFELANDSYLQLVGRRDILGRAVRDALPDVAGQGYFELLDKVLSSGEPFVGRHMPVELRPRADTGPEQRFVNLIYQPILEADGTASGIFVNGFDVTHQKRAEDQLQQLNETLEHRVEERTEALADALERLRRETAEREAAENALRQAQKIEALGKLTGGVAHDFNNLLQVISGNLQLLSKDVAGNDRAETRVQNAMAGVARGAKLASQLLAFGRRQALEPKVVNVGRFIKGMDDMLRRALGEEIEIETVVAGGLWNTLVDPGQIENAILNLAINARDAMDGHGKLTIEAGNASLDDDYARQHEDVTPGQYVMVGVTDTGGGIPQNVLERVFEPFFSTKPEGKGTGLGLSMVYGFVKQSGGHIKIYSEVGEGTTVKLYLPRVMQSEDVLTDTSRLPVRGGTETVLVVEDDDSVRETAVGLLSELGYRVLKARDASSALSVIESGMPIDLLFTDVVMPGPLRSPELARKAKERLPHMAVLFTSGYTENAIVHGGRLDPGVELLGKPYTREQLARKVRHVLGNEAQHRIAAEQLAQAAARSRPPPAPAAGRLTILLVEDDDLIRSTTAETLTDAGHVVVEAHDAESALQALAACPVDVLLADVGLPRVSGVDPGARGPNAAAGSPGGVRHGRRRRPGGRRRAWGPPAGQALQAGGPQGRPGRAGPRRDRRRPRGGRRRADPIGRTPSARRLQADVRQPRASGSDPAAPSPVSVSPEASAADGGRRSTTIPMITVTAAIAPPKSKTVTVKAPPVQAVRRAWESLRSSHRIVRRLIFLR
ncbi:response regulator [Phenylobacterium sp. J367]|uniref:hybrid sensor histidine kinase/response regulator n=1 Tax=Phenylobacterium sp. J367 TaxID=2898435 RepID=UPI0021518ABD|nr:response regulator [Phenylobacterium sp. J367]MCR5877395.1 response regulator [Phenylobacterium sp. J367]